MPKELGGIVHGINVKRDFKLATATRTDGTKCHPSYRATTPLPAYIDFSPTMGDFPGGQARKYRKYEKCTGRWKKKIYAINKDLLIS